MTPEKLLSYALPLFSGLSADDLRGLTIEATEQKLEPLQTVFDQEDDRREFYCVLSGSLTAVLRTPNGREIVFAHYQTGSYLGELAAIDGKLRSLTVVAKTDALVLVLKHQSFLQMFNEVPLIRERIAHDLVARIRLLKSRNMEMATLSVEQRVGHYLLRLVAQQGKVTNGTIIEDAPTHAEIAASIGANREMVSRSISKLSKLGVIKSARQRIEILDPEALAKAIL